MEKLELKQEGHELVEMLGFATGCFGRDGVNHVELRKLPHGHN